MRHHEPALQRSRFNYDAARLWPAESLARHAEGKAAKAAARSARALKLPRP